MAPFPTERMGTSELQVTLSCGCGRSVVARAKDAGGSVPCACGKPVAVPRLSELRSLAGSDAFVTNPAEAIRKQQAQGIRPAGDRCLLCGSMSPVFYACHALCESSHLKRGDADSSDNFGILLFRILFIPVLINAIYMSLRKKPSESEVRGHDIEVEFALPVCDPCAATTGKVTRPKIAKRLMANVPILAELLAYYPQLNLKINRPTS